MKKWVSVKCGGLTDGSGASVDVCRKCSSSLKDMGNTLFWEQDWSSSSSTILHLSRLLCSVLNNKNLTNAQEMDIVGMLKSFALN